MLLDEQQLKLKWDIIVKACWNFSGAQGTTHIFPRKCGLLILPLDLPDFSAPVMLNTIPPPLQCAYHFFIVAFYSIWVLFTHPQPVPAVKGDKPKLEVVQTHEYPRLAVKAIWTVGASVSAIDFWGLTYCCSSGPHVWCLDLCYGQKSDGGHHMIMWQDPEWSWAPYSLWDLCCLERVSDGDGFLSKISFDSCIVVFKDTPRLPYTHLSPDYRSR